MIASDPAARSLLDELQAIREGIQNLPAVHLGKDLCERVLQLAERQMLLEQPTADRSAARPTPGSLTRSIARRLFQPRAIIRTALNTLDPTGSMGYVTITGQISALRASLSKAAATTTSTYDTSPDDFGLAATSVSLANATSVAATKLTDADPTNAIAFSRAAEQVINIVTGGGAISGTTVVSPATGVFFPAGLNGLFK